MASLDFAFLAEFAKVESTTTITAVGAGIRGVEVVGGDQGSIQIYVAGGVNRGDGEEETTLATSVSSPKSEYTVSQSVTMQKAPSGGDFAMTVFAIGMDIPVVGSGKYQVSVAINEDTVRTLDLWIKVPAGDRSPGA